ncbi:LPXTG cell wall anchor domain-containing protein [Rothia sp. RSM407]|uniref:LPXTG cell wall anchor domain-containing protein n=1 Tax=Rothia sp. RSM407 TaxID=3398581 RepID=UPI002447EC25|nr:LPXTG cell wall anchor domain-containing protein [Rothia mucilaginosa]
MSKTTRRVYKIAAAAAFTAGSVAAIPATFAAEAPADQQQVVDQKASSQTSSLPGGNATETPKAEALKAEATEAPKTETPKADATETPKAETPAPTTPATPEPTSPATPAPEVKQADPSIVIEDARFPADAQLNTVNIVGAGFYGEKVGPGVQVSIYALDADNQITGEALATVVVPADQIQDGTFKGSITVETGKLPAGASYALSAVSNPQGQPDQRLVAISSFKVTESVTHAPETPKEETPVPVTTAPEAPKDETPAPKAPKEETPVPVTPTPEAPKEEAPAPEAPKDETPAPEAPKEEAPAPEAPKKETPAPEAPAVPENATLTTEDASLDPNDQYNVLTFNGSGFTHESVANGVQIAIFRLDASGNITGEALATHDVPASEIVNGTFRVKVGVLAELLQPGYAYAMVATSDPNGLVHQVAVTTATVSDANNPAPTLPAATEDDNTTVRDNGDGTTSVFTAEMREDGSVVVTETRMPTSQAPKAKVGNASAATSSSSKGHTVGFSGTKGSTSTSSAASSKPQLANTGAEGAAGIAGVGAATLIAGAALMLLRRRRL